MIFIIRLISLVWLTGLFGLAGRQVSGQRRVIGDIREQKVSQVADIDQREENVYRRPPTYLIVASRIVRPSTIYQVCWFLAGLGSRALADCKPFTILKISCRSYPNPNMAIPLLKKFKLS